MPVDGFLRKRPTTRTCSPPVTLERAVRVERKAGVAVGVDGDGFGDEEAGEVVDLDLEGAGGGVDGAGDDGGVVAAAAKDDALDGDVLRDWWRRWLGRRWRCAGRRGGWSC